MNKTIDYIKTVFYQHGKYDCLNEPLIKVIYMKLKIFDNNYSGFEQIDKKFIEKHLLKDLLKSYKNGYDEMMKNNLITIIKQKHEYKSNQTEKR